MSGILDRFNLKNTGLYLVTDSGLSKNGSLSDVENAVAAGCGIVQYREKSKTTREMVTQATEIKKLCEGKALFIVNDRIDIALAADADGVHIGLDDMPIGIARKLLGPDKIIGLTVHNIEESVEAERLGADYIGLSPIFDTATKSDAGKGSGITLIENVRPVVKLPIAAIGGIKRENVESVILAGADMAAVVSAIVCADDVFRETTDFIEIIRRAKALSLGLSPKGREIN